MNNPTFTHLVLDKTEIGLTEMRDNNSMNNTKYRQTFRLKTGIGLTHMTDNNSMKRNMVKKQ